MRAALIALMLAMPGVVGAADPCGRDARPDWRRVATGNDRTRLRNERQAWVDALAAVRAAPGGATALGTDAALFDPARAQDGATAGLTPGPYRCRVAKLGSRDPTMKPVLVAAWAPCTVTGAGDVMRLATTGEQRTEGRLFTDADGRTIFLGTLVLGDERRPIAYGRDDRRDMVGTVERIGDGRWRLVLPYPAFQSTLDLIEIARS